MIQVNIIIAIINSSKNTEGSHCIGTAAEACSAG